MTLPAFIVLAEAVLTLGLLTTALLAPGGPKAAAPAIARAPAPYPAQVAQARRPKAPTVKAEPAQAPLAKSPLVKAPPVKVSPVQAATDTPPASPPASEPATLPVAAADMPETGEDYRKARRQLLAKGFKPAKAAPPECRGPEPSVDACWGALVQFPEIETCANGSRGGCVGWWLAPDGRVLRIQTAGESGRIRDRHWASSGELDDLPKGWRP